MAVVKSGEASWDCREVGYTPLVHKVMSKVNFSGRQLSVLELAAGMWNIKHFT